MDTINSKIANLILKHENNEKKYIHAKECIIVNENIITIEKIKPSGKVNGDIYNLKKLLINPFQNLSAWQVAASNAVCKLKLNGISLNYRSNTYAGDSPLHLAVKNNCQYLVNTIINEYKSSILNIINFKNNLGETPLHIAFIGNYNPNILSELIRNGADFTSKDNNGQTPLVMLLLFWKNKNYLINAILDWIKDYNIHDIDKKGQNLIYLSAAYQNKDIYNKLIQMGCNPHLKADDGKCAVDIYEFNKNI